MGWDDKIANVQNLNIAEHPNIIYHKNTFKGIMAVSPWVFYEQIVVIDDEENSKCYMMTTSIPEKFHSSVEPLLNDPEVEKTKPVLAETICSIQEYTY